MEFHRVAWGCALVLQSFCTLAHAAEILYVHNTNSGEITKISIPQHEIIGTISVGLYMDFVASSPKGDVLYVNRIDSAGLSRAANVGETGELIAISTATDEVLWRVKLDGMPHHMIASMDGRYVFVPYYDSLWLAVVDVAKREVVKKIGIGHGGHGTKLSQDGKRLYVGSMMNDHVTIIDTDTFEILGQIPFDDGVRPFVITKDEKTMYLQLSRLHGFIVVDLSSRSVRRHVEMPPLPEGTEFPKFYPHNVNHGLRLTPDEKLLFANGSIGNFVAVYSHPALELQGVIPVGSDPNSIEFSKDGRFAYVTNRKSDDLSIISVKELREIKRMKLGKLPQRMVVIDVPDGGK